MELVLVPGFWLGADAWREVAPVIEQAGHHAHPLTLPGLESRESDRSAIGVREHVDAIVRSIDEVGDPSARDVVLVGHSGGGPLAYAATDARPERIARVVYVDSWPLGPDGVVAGDLVGVDGEVELPEWDDFEDADLIDLTDEQREAFRSVAVPEPAAVTRGPIPLSDDPRRRAVPATVVACEFTPADLQSWVDGGSPVVVEVGKLERLDVVELPTGHWPMFTRPSELGALLAELADR
ncbi:alpha/beta hydrolase [Leifsonia sp. fls2-241-R2A-40a]|uniref:alpha/beta fold hydrolase n=1 Tax=Leifsonia sp. fls2-241-R2A-40a TaxID=3040290 RepID=UPI00254B9CCA|nr:alpha/beta hydrolase [Leifsonia sp. fls2-241-R2A-40a]